ncbi:hypothetical protein BDN70DRAFT_875284 [Pholiota conissans]|uniref:Zn(2)-C6 fungal-type domain-containing protein n=1 Tax=Pholiota conissans TaxID=109636 RepID=A0A9P6CWS6_9AGAR|nr:hypothetical protein BDN70DRAFT_875284 [Pholiota conissans]
MESETSQTEQSQLKVKKTRRRLRLSCVECTKRRQKCDRKHPCSLCVSRGVAHLCRWESVPLARPPPARPPASALVLKDANAPEPNALVLDLKQRIAALEHELEQARGSCSSPSVNARSPSSRMQSTPPFSGVTDSVSGGASSAFSPPQMSESLQQKSPPQHFAEHALLNDEDEPEIGPPSFPLDENAYEATSTLAQLSLAHHGEFIGRGSLICALHAMTAKTTPRFLYAKSTDAMSEFREPVQRFSNIPFAATIEDLVPNLPTMMVVEALTAAFFEDVNWRYGIPEDWFRRTRGQMWMNLQHRQASASQINANWLMLLFAILASAPQSAYDDVSRYAPMRSSDDYFMCSMMARRMVEDDYLDVPSASFMVSAADGTVLGCLATPLLCDYLAERGRISEAWKLVGNAIRNAISVGLHRDPEWKLWQMMSADEKLLRRRAWWGLFTSDKTYSTVLSRPQVLRREIYDVALYSPHNPDGSRNLFNVGQNVTVSLMELLGDALEKCFTTDFPGCEVFFEMDRRFQEWEERLPSEYQLRLDAPILQECSPSEMKILTRQRYTLHTWYLTGRLKLFIASATGQGRAPQPSPLMRRTMEECINLSIQVIRFQTAAYQTLFRPNDDLSAPTYPGNCWLFEGCFSLFEASVALITVMSQLPCQDKVGESNRAIDSVLHTFMEVVKREQGRKTAETAARAMEVLITIREQHWPKVSKLLQLNTVKDEPTDPIVYKFMDLDQMGAGVSDAQASFNVLNPFVPSASTHHFTTSTERHDDPTPLLQGYS